MRPKRLVPSAARISISTVSPAFMNGVSGLPFSMVSIMRRSARQEMPRARSAFDTVPEPTMVPAVNARVLRDVRHELVETRSASRDPRRSHRRRRRCRWCARARCRRPPCHSVAELVGRDGEGRERRRRLGLEEAEALGQLGRHEVAQRDVVGEHHQLDVRGGVVGARALRRVVEDDADLGLEVEAPRRVGEHDVVGGREQHARAALVDERVGAQRLRRLGAARLAHQDHVVQERRAVDPLVGARQRRVERAHVERLRRRRAALERARRARAASAPRAPSRRAPPAASARSRSPR